MTIVYGILALGLIIFIHELGHFIAARLCGVKVESFSIGMGPVLLHKKIKDTDYRLSLIPLGGYCGMKGQKDLDFSTEDIPLEKIEKDSFYGVSPFKRIIIAFFGPFFNFLFAIIAYTIIAITGYTFYSTDSRIVIADEIYPEIYSAAGNAGIKTGDKIIQINEKKINYFSDISSFVATHPDENLIIQVLRDNETLTFEVKSTMDKDTGAGKIGVMNFVEPVINTIQEKSIASESGLAVKDKIIKCNGMEIKSVAELQKLLTGKETAELVILRDNTEIPVTLTVTDNIGIGFEYLNIEAPRYSLIPAIFHGIKETGDTFSLTLKSIGLLFKGINLSKAVSGPLRITVMLGDTAKEGFSQSFRTGLVSVLNFLALISISLFIMNLLPIPVLDGGIICFSLIEAIIKKPVSKKVYYYVQLAGIALIAVLFVIAMFGDVSYILNLWRNR